MSDEEFFKRLREMSNVELAEKLEVGGELFAPNPHYVLEAARRLRNFKEYCKHD